MTPLIKCTFYWQWNSDDGISFTSYTKDISLPFFPRRGDEFHLDGRSPVAVESSEFDIDNGHANVFCEDWLLRDSFELTHRRMVDGGWKYCDRDGEAPDLRGVS